MDVVAKTTERLEARKLRRKGKSIGFIANKIGVSKSSASIWCGDITLTKEQRDKLIKNDKKGGAVGRAIANRNKVIERLDRLEKYKYIGRKMVGSISKRDLLILGIALYWGEGNKKGRRLIFSNSDPEMIKIWIRWLRECLNLSINDMSCNVGINQIHRHRVASVEKYWSEISGIPLTEFRKVSLKKVKAMKVYENPEEHFGTLCIRVKRSTNLNYQMLGLIEGLRRHEAK
jgi:hypothetical protein